MPTRTPGFRPLTSTIAALAATTMLVAGCGGDAGGPDVSEVDPAQLLTSSAAYTDTQQSVRLLLETTGEIPELPITRLEGDLTNTPEVAAAGDADITFLGQSIAGVEFVVTDGTLFGAITPGNWEDFGPAADIYDVSVILNPDTGLANLLNSFADPVTEGTETVDGVDTVRIGGLVTADAVNGIAPQLGVTSPVPGTAWIEADGDNRLVRARLEPTPDTSVQMTLSSWGEPVTVTTPAL